MRSAFVDIIKTRGVQGLYSGLSPTLVEIIPYAGLQFGSYDTFKRSMMVMTQTYSFAHTYIVIIMDNCSHVEYMLPRKPNTFL